MFACSLLARMRGLLFRKGFVGEMLICPCRSIHTFGMGESIDVAFVDRFGTVVLSRRGVSPSRTLRCHSACAVIERMSLPNSSWYEEGQCLQSFFISKDRGINESMSGLRCEEL